MPHVELMNWIAAPLALALLGILFDEFAEVSGSAHSNPENCGTLQAFCTATMKMADSLRLFALLGRSSPENRGTSQAICMF